jgi:hypothetical protein
VADLAFVAVTVAFFALCAAYVAGCARIVGADPSVDLAPELVEGTADT